MYLDLGTNVGIQFRKLYTPDAYPEALIRPSFEKYFGMGQREDVCAWGWEPNSRHAAVLTKLQAEFHALTPARRVSIFTETAAGVFDGWGVFRTDNDFKNEEWGGWVDPVPAGQEPPKDAVRVMDVANWIDTNILRRCVSPANVSSTALAPAIVVKIDIEGSDEKVLFAMLHRGVLCAFDFIYVEVHVRNVVVSFLNEGLQARGCKTKIAVMDDETYHNKEWRRPKRGRGKRSKKREVLPLSNSPAATVAP